MKQLITAAQNRLDGTRLKTIGLILMVWDHIHQMFVGASPDFIRLNMLGRLVAPIFLFMVAEGMHFTRNRKSYLLLLLAGSIVMTLGDYFLQVRFPVEDVMLMNNIFATFLVTGLYIVFYDLLVEGIKVKSATKILAAIGRMLLPIAISFLTLQMIPFPYPALYLISMVLPNLIFIEWGFTLVILGVLFYALRQWRWAQVGALAAFSLINFLMQSPESWPSIQRMMVFAALPILLYNGKKGKGRKWLFYIFYPAHIFLLYLLAYFLR